jgi:branched-chain amino acid transport system substrate-binding protein
LALMQHGASRAGATPLDGVSSAAILGHPIRLSFGCTDGSTASALKEARRLVENVRVDVLIGSATGDEELALQDYARRRPTTAFVNGSGSLRLPDPARNFFSFHVDGAQWSAGEGGYAYHDLGWRRAVTIADEHNMFNWSETAGFLAEFCSLGGKIVKRIGVPSGTQDFSAVIARLPRTGIDGIYVASTSGLPIALIKANPFVHQNVSRRLLLGRIDRGYLDSARRLPLNGIAYTDRLGPGGLPSGSYAAAFRRAFPKLDPRFEDVFDQDYYVAMKATLQALAGSGGDLSHGERRFLAALAHVHLLTPNGPVRLDASHQAIATTYLWQVTRFRFDHTRLLRTIPNVERTFGGYLTDHDPPPRLSTPACRAGHVAGWAR